jgi:hypothetical protein
MVDEVALGQVFLRVSYAFYCSPFHNCSIFIYHRLLMAAIAVTRQHPPSLLVRGFIFDPALRWHTIRKICFLVRDSAVGIATGYGLDGQGIGIRVPGEARFFSFPRRLNRFWGPPSFLSNESWGLFPQGQIGRGVKLTTHLQLVPSSSIRGSTHPLHICPRGAVFN